MKRIFCASLLAMSLLSFAAPGHTAAQTAGQSAKGAYRFSLEDDLTKYVEFDARTDDRGVTSGYMTFTDEAKIPDKDVNPDDDSREQEAGSEIYVKVEFDFMTVEKNRAVMNGTVMDSSHRTYVGRWVQLVVEDNGDNFKLPDRLTWVFCRPEPGGWIPTDYERKYDDGAYLRWWATDYERKDDVGIPSKSYISNELRSCQTYTLSTYNFVDAKKGEGNIVVGQ